MLTHPRAAGPGALSMLTQQLARHPCSSDMTLAHAQQRAAGPRPSSMLVEHDATHALPNADEVIDGHVKVVERHQHRVAVLQGRRSAREK